MLIHGSDIPIRPNRVVVIGANGFIASEVVAHLEVLKVKVVSLGRPSLDLLSEDAAKKLADEVRPDDTIFIASAKAPVRDLLMLQENLKMIGVICDVLKKKPVAHVIYLSSDAVYKDSINPLTEKSCAEPESLHGVMHLSREIALRTCFSGPLAIVRSTLVYGVNDPHNGYGPNRFIRLALSGKDIILFGKGGELRDHVDVRDVAKLITKIAFQKSSGIVNAVSGEVVSFREIAEFISLQFERQVAVIDTPRIGQMPHNGLRAFGNDAIQSSFPNFYFQSWRDGLIGVIKELKDHQYE